ncbi:hypothetical protein VCSRO140_3200 [Vibrio cholerae]|nr:hypothetical protein VCSRO140_3200 [Vibrio cholerae]
MTSAGSAVSLPFQAGQTVESRAPAIAMFGRNKVDVGIVLSALCNGENRLASSTQSCHQKLHIT